MSSPNINATTEDANNKLDGIDNNGNPLPWRQTAMLYTANLFGLGKDYAFPETANCTPSQLSQVTTLTKLLTRKYTMPDGNDYDAWDMLVTLCKDVVARNPHINDSEKNSVNFKATS